MTSQPSSLTPLGFAREYQAYRAANSAIPFPDSRLLAAARFWSRFPETLASDSYSSFWLEDLPPLLAVDARVFDDFHPDELAEVATLIARLDSIRFNARLTPASLWEQSARKWLYVGEEGRAIESLGKAGLGSTDFTKETTAVGAVEPQLLPSALTDHLGDHHEALKLWLTRFDTEWRALRESGHTNQATCVLVERDSGGKPVRGRLRTLEAHIETLPKGRDSDEVVFGHQLCTADDPQVRGAYAAVASLRQLTRGSNAEFGIRNAEVKSTAQPNPHSAIRNPHSYFRARFTFANDNREPYGGDSLAFACFTAAYSDRWSKDLHRERRLIAAQVALTGALTSDGQAESVAEISLEQKIERVFYSPLSCLVVPHGNRAAAEGAVAVLHSKYPNRRLRIITAERAGDLISDGNITIPERVCLGEYALLAAAKYSASLKVQVPILVLLLAIFGWLAVPKIKAILDEQVTDIEHAKSGFTAINKYGHELWKTEYLGDSLVAGAPYVVHDLDGDGKNEVLFYVCTGYGAPINAKVDVFNSDGTLRFRLDLPIMGQYPGDYSSGEVYTPGLLQVVTADGIPLIVTSVNAQNPSRFHIRIWSARGDSLGWYVNAGVTGHCLVRDCDFDGTDDIVIAGYNIRMRAVALIALRSEGSYGVAPPYWDSQYDLSRVVPGNQLHYMIFPRADLTELFADRLYNELGGLHDVSARGFRFDVLEGGVRGASEKERYWAINYYLDSTLRLSHVDVDDTYKARRESLVRSDSLPEIPWPEYFAHLTDTVMYWTSKGWTTHRALYSDR